MTPLLSFSLITLTVLVLATSALAGEENVAWRIRDMTFTRGDMFRTCKWDGTKSILTIPGDGKTYEMNHGISYMDLTNDEFVLELGEVSQGVSWEMGARPLDQKKTFLSLMKGSGGGTYRVLLSKLGLPRWARVDAVLKVKSDKPGAMEALSWTVISPKPVRFYREHQKAAKQLAKAKATPLERGIVPHWNPEIGGFVCAYNATHPEHYNYWLEDEGEQLWSLGNYPEMMKLYGKGLRDFIVNHCRHGAPVRRQNDQPLSANPFLNGGSFEFHTGLLYVKGNLGDSPHINLHHDIYEEFGLLASIAEFFVSYKDSDGSTKTLQFSKPASYSVDYSEPKANVARLVVKARDSAVAAEFTIDVYRDRATVSAAVNNTGSARISDVRAGFRLINCQRYYKHPLNSSKRFGDVALLWGERKNLEDCNIVRVAGPAVKLMDVCKDGEDIDYAGFTAAVATRMEPGAEESLKLGHINAGSTCFAEKIENYKDVDFADADISMSYVGTYALLGLATYSYRFPEDAEARASVNMMIDNFLQARDRARDRELGYLLWVLTLYNRTKDANEIADLLEKRVEGRKFNSLDGSAMCIGLRRAGRWAAADKIGNEIDPLWEEGVAPPTDFVGLGMLQSPKTLERAYLQLSRSLWMMYWDDGIRITTHNHRIVEEGPQETNCYLLVGLDFLSRNYGGITPIRLDAYAKTTITGLAYDEKTGEWKMQMKDAADVDLFTHFRKPKTILWNGKVLASANWRYSGETGVIYVCGLSGEGELVVTVDGPAPKDDAKWKPIDYVGMGKG